MHIFKGFLTSNVIQLKSILGNVIVTLHATCIDTKDGVKIVWKI